MPPPPPSETRHFEVLLNRKSGTLSDIWHPDLPTELGNQFAVYGVTARVRALLPDELDKAFQEAIAANPDALIVGGGDGTVSTTAKHLAGGTIPMGVLPFGTFNLAARDLGIPLEMEDAVKALAQAPVEAIDMLQVGDRACLCTSIIGFYPALAKREQEYHGQAWWKKAFRLVGQMCSAWRHSPPLNLKITTAEGESRQVRTRFVAFVPGEYDDIFSVIPRRHELADGTMTIYLSRHRSLLALLRGCLAYLIGMLNEERDIERIKTTAAKLVVRRRKFLSVMIDGEVLDLKLPLKFRIRPAVLKVLKPERRPQ